MPCLACYHQGQSLSPTCFPVSGQALSWGTLVLLQERYQPCQTPIVSLAQSQMLWDSEQAQLLTFQEEILVG